MTGEHLLLLNARHELIITHPSYFRQENLSLGQACSRMSLLKCFRPHSSTHVPLHLRYAIKIIMALTRAPHSQLFNKLRSTYIQDTVAFLYTSPSPSTFSPLHLYFLPLYIRLNLFYLNFHSFCWLHFFLFTSIFCLYIYDLIYSI